MPPPSPANSHAPERRPWQVLLEARRAPAEGLVRSPWLAWRGADCLGAGEAAPAAARPWLDLYAPLLSARPGRPLVLAHLGQSLDGFIATASGDSYYVTGPENVRHLHRLRALSAAVVVGAGTVARDDPQLTVRHVEGDNPVRVIVDPNGRLDARHRVFVDGDAETLVVRDATAPGPERFGRAEVVRVPVANGELALDALLAALHARALWSVFVEGGGTTVSRFLAAGLLDRLHVAVAPLVTGNGRRGLDLPARDKIAECLRPSHRVFTMGGDVLFDCDLRAGGATSAAPTLTRAF
jgi:diaminohydroxyphosphoribosylaminopyrimidine deaminase / 5-amino-6-(5-phosphoribosylamino)uracil reductase